MPSESLPTHFYRVIKCTTGAYADLIISGLGFQETEAAAKGRATGVGLP